jgi:hypothetical protein
LRVLNQIQRIVAVFLCSIIITLNIACTVTVIPPTHPTHPTVVYLCDYGVHSSLLLPVSKGHYVEYLYGDWNWAALCRNSWIDALGAIFWSRQATLGRRYVDQLANQTMPIPPDRPRSEVPILVNGDGCTAVLQQMDQRWSLDRAHTPGPGQVVSDFWYVKDDQHYYWLHDCNLNTADSLAAMGCKIHGYAVWSSFAVQNSHASR